jgi:epoxyqueuosine reductase QueG
MESLNEWIIQTIERLVRENDNSHGYRRPIVGFTTADDPGFMELRRTINPDHFLPEDLLSGAKSVVSFFVPVSEDTALGNLEHSCPSIGYAHVKWAQKGLMENIIESLKTELLDKGIRCSSNTEQIPFVLVPPYHPWLQKPIAVMCGVGKFGLNRQIITKSGCAGRLGSIAIDAETVPTGRIQQEYCLYLVDGSCGECVKNCPVNALRYDSIDRNVCKKQIHRIQETYEGDLKIVDSCAQCVAMPCAISLPTLEKMVPL